MQDIETKLLKEFRAKIIDMAVRSGSAHIAPAFSVMEIVYTLYTKILRVDPKNPKWEDRDRFILSKGHGGLALYMVLAHLGFFPKEWLDGYAQPGSVLGGHSELGIPGVEASTGSLGHGLPIGGGMAYAAKYDKKNWRVFVAMSDGECEEGSTWEAIMGASSFKLDNLTAVVDYNHVQSCGPVLDVLSSFEPFADKWRAFGWSVREVNGHKVSELEAALKDVPFEKDKPSVIIAHTVKGKGISYMENVPIWHYRVPNPEETKQAYKELGCEEYLK
ncbi:MAG: transketolase [Parcubacteria group bacterium]|nr:transketolase [Parcubacteria group bacterium]